MKRNLWTVLAALAFALPGWSQDKVTPPPAKKSPPAPLAASSLSKFDGLPIVFVANGSGGSFAVSDKMKEVAEDTRIRLVIQPVIWCRHNTSCLDHADTEAHLAAAARLAECATLARKHCPHSPIIFVGHSSGTRVILAAAEMMPGKSLQRVFLLAPSVSCNYNLSLAMRATKGGIESFWSEYDNVLDLAADYVGTADGQKTLCAGRVGFAVPKNIKGTGYEYLTQVKWTEGIGGLGGHFTWASCRFMHAYLVPAMYR